MTNMVKNNVEMVKANIENLQATLENIRLNTLQNVAARRNAALLPKVDKVKLEQDIQTKFILVKLLQEQKRNLWKCVP